MVTSSQIITPSPPSSSSLFSVSVRSGQVRSGLDWSFSLSSQSKWWVVTSPAFFQLSLLSSPVFTALTAVHLCHNGAPAENGPESWCSPRLTTNHWDNQSQPAPPPSQPMGGLAAGWRWTGAGRGARRDRQDLRALCGPAGQGWLEMAGRDDSRYRKRYWDTDTTTTTSAFTAAGRFQQYFSCRSSVSYKCSFSWFKNVKENCLDGKFHLFYF